jgi:hypothetical protein
MKYHHYSKGGIMPTSKNPITKNQIGTHFAEKFELSKKTASSIIDEMAMLATNETKKTGASYSLALVNLSLLSAKHVWEEIQPRVNKSKFPPRLW